MNAVEQAAAELDRQLSQKLSFLAVEVGESAALGGDVRLELSPRTTVLVGKNSAGKSLLLEKMHAAISDAGGVVSTPQPDPVRLACEIDAGAALAGDRPLKLRYECHWHPRTEEAEDSSTSLRIAGDPDIQIEESCWIIGMESSPLWRVEDGLLLRNDGSRSEIPVGRTLLNWTLNAKRRGTFLFPKMAQPLRELFLDVILIPAGIPRNSVAREELTLPYPDLFRSRVPNEMRRMRWLAYRLADWHEKERECFDEFMALGRRTGLFDEVKVKLYRDPEAGSAPPTQRRDMVSILFDGVNLGLLSDGTLRVAEILAWLIFPEIKLLLIEEPETAVHPGLLSKLLAEIEAYSSDRQVVLSTQSPQVVSWVKPDAIRLVERRSGRTEVRSLRESDIARLSGYLHDEGTLGDFVYSGALDG